MCAGIKGVRLVVQDSKMGSLGEGNGEEIDRSLILNYRDKAESNDLRHIRQQTNSLTNI